MINKKEKVISASTHFHKVDHNAFEGITLKGSVETTIAGGEIAFDKGQVILRQGKGKYLERPPFGFPFERIQKISDYYDPLKRKVDRIN